LNIKKLRARLVGVTEATVELSIKGPKVVTAKDITNLGGVVEITNTDEYLCELTDKVDLKVEITFTSGIGFMGRESIRREKLPAGTIVLDSVFSPIRKASYVVDNMRVGERTDYNRLEIAIETDGTLTPREAFEQSLSLMINQLRAIANLKEEFIDAPRVAAVTSGTEEAEEDMEDSHTDALKTRIDTLGLSTRVMNALSEANIRTLGGLVRKAENDLLELEGFGSKGLDEIKEVLTRFDLKLKD
jgi:DNA-directed RNA polymerase subunit alpha